jgi:hypothetical protein
MPCQDHPSSPGLEDPRTLGAGTQDRHGAQSGAGAGAGAGAAVTVGGLDDC